MIVEFHMKHDQIVGFSNCKLGQVENSRPPPLLKMTKNMGGAMVLRTLPVPRHPTIWMIVGVGADMGCFGHVYFHLSFLFSFSLALGDGPILTEILSQRAVKLEITNQSMTKTT